MGPAWLGIGAQRCGTTWLTNLIVQHPDVTLPADGRKEQHELHLVEVDINEYRARFPPGAGECTPRYLRWPTAPTNAARVLGPTAPVIAILRDPIERFASAYRLRTRKTGEPVSWSSTAVTDYVWGGMYADQLDLWTEPFGDQLIVLQYEQVRADPQPYVDQVWKAMGLDPVPLTDVDRPSATSTDPDAWVWPVGLRDSLRALYRPQLPRLARWGIDPDLWTV